ncbi:MAG: hypothetical protein IJ939_05545 [Clostridia bacterium]|nr:hypothetical protein [Clostridia bacterium]
MTCGDKKIIFIFNNSDIDRTFELDGKILSFGADATICGNSMTIKNEGIGYAILE